MNKTSATIRLRNTHACHSFSALRKSLLAVPVIALAMAGHAPASTKTWDPSLNKTGSNGSGTWDTTTAEWATGSADATLAATDDAVVGVAGGSGTYTIGIATAGVTANSLTLNPAGTGSYIFGTAGALGTLNLTSGMTINNSATFNTNVVQGGTATDTFTAANATLTYNAGGSIGANFSGSQAATASIILNTGTYGVGGAGQALNIGSAGTFGTDPGLTAPTSGLIINSGTLTTSASFSTGNGGNGLTTVNGGTINNSAGGYIIVGRATTAALNTFGRVVLDTGTITGLNVLINHQGSGGTGGGEFDINGGLLNETGQIAIGSSATGGNAILNIAGGNATFGQINFGSIAGQAASTGGTGTLTLSGGSLYVGAGGINNALIGTPTYAMNLSGGTLGAAADWNSSLNMAVSNTVTIQAADSTGVGHTIALGGNLTGTGNVIKTGAGTLKLSGANAATLGTATVSGGTLQYANEGAFYGGSSITSTTAAKVTANSGGTVALNVGGTGEFTSADVAVLAASGAFASGSAIGLDTTDAGGSFTLSNGLAGSFGLTKLGTGTLAVTGANTYSGATTINAGTLDLGAGGATGSINAASALVLNKGTLTYTESGATSQTFAGTTFSGNSFVKAVAGDTLVLGALTQSNNGLIDFSNTGKLTTTSSNDAGGILGAYATVNGTDWATNNGTQIVAYTGYETTTAGGTTAANYAGKNVDVTSSTTLAGAIAANTIRFNTNAAETLTLSGAAANTLTDGGILVTPNVGAFLSTISTGTLEGSASGNLVVDQNNTSGGLTISSIIANNGGATGLVKNGSGTLTLSGANTFTGTTTLNAGVVSLTSANALNTAAANGGITFAGGTLQYNGSTTDYSADIKNSTSAISIDINGKSVTWANVLGATNVGGLTVTDTSAAGNGVLNLSNAANLFSGPININSGILALSGAAAYGNASSITVANGAALQLAGNRTFYGPTITLNGTGVNGNGALEDTVNTGSYEGLIVLGSSAMIGADTGISMNIQGDTLTNNGFTLTTGGAGNITFTSDIVGSGTLIKTGTGTDTFNTQSQYTGGTTIKAGTAAGGTAAAFGTGTITLGDSTGSANATLNLTVSNTFANPLVVASGTTGNTLTLGFTANSPTYGGAITLGHDLVVAASGNGTNTISGGITGTGNLTIINTGTANSTVLSTGTLNFVGSITNTGTGTVATTISAPLGASITGVTENSATSPLTLSGTNTNYTGTTTLTTGTLKLGNAQALGGGGSSTGAGGPLVISGGTLDVTSTQTITTVNAENWNGNFNFGSSGGLNLGAGAVTLGANVAFTNSGANLFTETGAIGGTGNLTLNTNGTGNVILGLGGVNFTGTLTNSGTGTTTNVVTSGTSLFGATSVIQGSIGNNVTGIVQNSATSQLILGGNNSTYTNGITIAAGQLDISNYAANTNAALGAATDIVTLGTGAANASLNYAADLGNAKNGNATVAGIINVQGTGNNTISVTDYSPTFTGSITLGNGVTASNLTLAVINNGGSSMTFSGGIGGTGNITVSTDFSNAGNLVNINTGTLNNAGTITFNNASVNGDTAGTGTGTNVISSNIGSAVTGITENSTNPLLLSGSNNNFAGSVTDTLGTIKLGSALALNSANTVLQNATTGTATLDVAGFTDTIAGLNTSGSGGTDLVTNSTLTASTLTFGGTGNFNSSATISGTALGLAMAGSGTQTLTGTNTYALGTKFQSGVLNAGSAGALGTTGNLNFLGGTLQYGSGVTTDYSSRIVSSTGAISIDTNGNSVSYGTALASSNNGGLTKLGTGTLILGATEAYTGTTTVSNGTLQVGTGSAGSIVSSSAVVVGASSTLAVDLATGGTFSNAIADSGTVAGIESGSNTISGNISGTGGFSQTGTGTTSITGTNTYSGATSITAGTVIATNAGVAGVSSALGQNSALTMGASGGTLTLGSNIQVGSIAGGGATGGIGSGGFVLTTGGNNTNTSYAGVISSTGGLTKIGTGTQILTGVNTYTGTTTVNAGTLQINEATGSLAAASSLTLGGGTLNLLGSTTSNTNQTIAALNLTNGTASVIALTPANATGTLTTLTIASGTLPSGTGSVNFNYVGGGNGTTNGSTLGNDYVIWTSAGLTAGNLIGGGYTVTDAGGNGFATVNASGDVIRLSSSTPLPTSGGTSTVNYVVNQSFSTTNTATPGSLVEALSGSVVANTVTIDTTGLASGANLALGANTLTITNGGGILINGANNYTISATGAGGIKNSASSLGSFAFNNYDTGTVTISAPILNSGQNAVVFNGTGTTILSGANTYGGATIINGGTVNLTGTLVSATTVNSGATYNLGAGARVTSGVIAINSGASFSENSTAIISGASGITLGTGFTGTVTLSSANTYTGATTINGGTLSAGIATVGTSGPFGNGSAVTFANVAGATLDISSAGGNVSVGALQGGGTTGGNVTLGANTLTIGNAGSTYAGNITGTGGIIKIGTGAENFSGTNTFSGGITVKAGSMQILGAGGAGTGTLTIGDSANTGVAATLSIQAAGTYANAINVTGTGVNTLNGNQTETVSGAIVLNPTSPSTSTNLTILSVSNPSTQTYTGGITGTGNVTLSDQGVNQGAQVLLFTGGSLNNVGTISNIGVNTGNNNTDINSVIGTNVTGVIENSLLTKLILSGANTYTGPTTITAGTLMLGGLGTTSFGGLNYANATTTGSISTSSTITGNGTFAINRSNAVVQGVDFTATALTGGLGFTQMGTGTTTLTSANTYTGATTVTGGTLQIGNGSTGSISDSSATTVTAQPLSNNSGTSGTLAFDEADGGSYNGTIALTNVPTVSGPVLLATLVGLEDAGKTNTLGGVVSGTGNFIQSGAGTTVLSGANTYTGTTTLAAGVLNAGINDVAGTSGALGNGGPVTFTGGTLQYGSGISADYSARIKSSSAAISVDTNGQSVTYGSAIDATNVAGLTKLGSGTLTLGGSNLYTGTTTLTGGTLAISSAANLNATVPSALAFNGGTLDWTTGTGTLTQASTITAGQTATIQVDGTTSNLTLAGAVGETAASGSLTKTGTGTLTFAADNLFTGPTTINAGVLDYNDSVASSVSPITVASGATAQFEDGINPTASLTISGSGAATANGALDSVGSNLLTGSLTLAGNATISSDLNAFSGNESLTINGPNITGAGKTLTVTGVGSTEIDSIIATGTGGLTKTGTGTLLLDGANTYTGATQISNGEVDVDINPSTAAIGTLGVNSAVTLANTSGAKLKILDGISVQVGSLAGGGTTGGGISFATGANTLTTGGDNTSTSYGGVISGAGKLAKIGTGTQVLSGANTYTGGTTIAAGNLQITGSTSATGTLTVGNNNATVAILSGTGTIGGKVNAVTTGSNIAYLAAGTNGSGARGDFGSAGTLTINGALNIGTGTNLDFDLATATTVGGGVNDLISVGAGLTLGTSTTVNINALGTLSTGVEYTLITSTGVTGFSTDVFTTTGLTGGETATYSVDALTHALQVMINAGDTGADYFNGTSGNLNVAASYDIDQSTGTAASVNPSATSNLFFSANRNTTLTTGTVTSNLEVNSVNFGVGGTTSTFTVAGTNTLTIDATTANSNAAGSGITIATGGGSAIVNAPLALGNDQTWTPTDAASTLTINGQVSGAHKLTTAGAGTTVLANATGNTYSGGTEVSSGTLYANGGTATRTGAFVTSTSGSATGTGAVLIDSGAKLGGSGVIKSTSGGVTVASGGTLISGDIQAGTTAGFGLTLDNSANLSKILTVQDNATLSFSLGTGATIDSSDFAHPATQSTFLTVLGNTTGEIQFGTNDTINLVDLTGGHLKLTSSTPYLLIQAGGGDALSDNNLYAGLTTSGGVVGTAIQNGWVTNLNLTGLNGTTYPNERLYLYDGDLEVVPEPGTWALMIGGLAVLVIWQRRRSKQS